MRNLVRKFKKWYRRRLFLQAYRILRNEFERHRAAGHSVVFSVVNESHIRLECRNCPEIQPDDCAHDWYPIYGVECDEQCYWCHKTR